MTGKYILPGEKDQWFLKSAGILLWFLLKCLAIGSGIAAFVVILKVVFGV